MRTFYKKDSNYFEYIQYSDGYDKLKVDKSLVDSCIAENTGTLYKSFEEYRNSTKYQRDRALAFDPIPEQLDQIYHDMDGWKKRIKAVKDKYPKPE